MPEEHKWETYIARPTEVEAYQAKERTIVLQKSNERTTGLVYAQVGAWIIRAQGDEQFDSILSDEEFKRLYQPGKKGEGTAKVPKKEKEKEEERPVPPVEPSAMEEKS